MSIGHVIFRVDASIQMGTGHFMRCITLADKLKKRGSAIRFICRKIPEHFRKLLIDKEIELKLLDSHKDLLLSDGLQHRHWLGVSQEQDAADSVMALDGKVWDWAIVDHYSLGAHWETMLRKSNIKIMAIDDLADRSHNCDLLLDQNFYIDANTRYLDKAPSQCRFLLGPSYALLREEFRELHNCSQTRVGPVRRILVFMGGVDVDNYTGMAINVLSKANISGLRVDVVIGRQHPFSDRVQKLCHSYGFVCHVQTEKMAELIQAADLGIGAGGSANWERSCLGLPCVVGAVAMNQIQAARDLSLTGAIKYIGAGREITEKRLAEEIVNACDQDWLSKASSLCLNLVDARGSERVVNIMEET